jgi:hypothetical protein
MSDEHESQPQTPDVPPAGSNGHAPSAGSSHPPESLAGEQSQKLAVRKATGPRTLQGKQRSNRNATKHGIFSDVTLLPGESVSKYRSLLEALKNELTPEGELEEFLVEKLANIIWRQRRYLLFEKTEISRGNNVFADAAHKKQNKEARYKLLDQQMRWLRILQRSVRMFGLNVEDVCYALNEIFEINKANNDEVVGEIGSKWDRIFDDVKAGNPPLPDVTDEERKSWYVNEIEKDIKKLGDAQDKLPMPKDPWDTEEQDPNCKIAETVKLDHLLRYDASLERSFDRTLNQLERLQSRRRGQPAPPRIDVNISTES